MTNDPTKMSCAEFQAKLPELIGSGADAASHPHIQNCELCRALLADLETIAEAARQLFPSLTHPTIYGPTSNRPSKTKMATPIASMIKRLRQLLARAVPH